MTKIEEALCEGITFSVPRMVPTAIQEGEIDNALYYVTAYLSPDLDKVVLKFYDAPSYEPLMWEGRYIDCVTLELEDLSNSYNFGDDAGDAKVYPHDSWISCNPKNAYNGLMLYPGLKCIIINILKAIE